MGYEIMYKKVFLKATDEMGVDLYTPVCFIGPNNVTQRHWTGNHYSERRCRDWTLMLNALALNKEGLYDKFAHMMQPNRADCEMWKMVVGGYMARIFGAGWIPAWLLLLPSRIC